MKENRLAVALYPGSFDPVHNGHLDIIDRARRMFRRVIVGVAENADKEPMFGVTDRVAMLRAAGERTGVAITSFEGLTVEFAHRVGAGVIVKGLRAMMDFEYELKMAAMNKRLRPDIETVFLMTAPEFAYLSSTLIREVARFGGSVSGLIPPAVERRLVQKFSRSHQKR